MSACQGCGTKLPARAKFCPECGASRDVPETQTREVRKVVTVLFSDVTGSTALAEELDSEAVRTLMGRYFTAMNAEIARHGGTVEKFIGDAIMAVFGIPVIHEDDALRAVRAAVDMREALAGLNTDLLSDLGVTITTRTGITTGEVVAGSSPSDQTLVTGDTVNTAARLEQAAAPGEILIGDPTWTLVRAVVTADVVEPLRAKGKALPVAAYRLRSITPVSGRQVTRLDRPLVGRQPELQLLTDLWRRAAAGRSPQLCTLFGAAGIGKSRLMHEFLATVGGNAQVLRGRCLPYGEGITYWPLAEALGQATGMFELQHRHVDHDALLRLLDGAGDAELMARRLATAIGASEDAAPQTELFWAVRRTFEHLAGQQPLVVAFEDIHWAESTFLDLIDHIAHSSRDVPIFLLTTARPELLDTRPDWDGHRPYATSVVLEGLPTDATRRLINDLPGGESLPDRIRMQLAETADGNPLFVEELLAMMADEGVLRETAGRWEMVREVTQFALPPSIQALLAARLDRLPADERKVAERASVVGRIFEPEAVAALSPDTPGALLNKRFMALVRKHLIGRDRSEITGSEAFRFRHILIRDAAYQRLPKRERAQLHERFAEWLEPIAGDRYAEILGYHLEASYDYRRQIGRPNAAATVVAQRAARYLHAAGRRTAERGDSAAAGLLRRAVALLDGHDPLRAAAELELGIAPGVPMPERLAVLDHARHHARASGDERLELEALAEGLWFLSWADPVGAAKRRGELTALTTRLRQLQHDRGLARVLRIVAEDHMVAGASAAAIEAIEEALTAARAIGDKHLEQLAQERLIVYAAAGHLPASQGLTVLADVLASSSAGPVLRSKALGCAAVLHAMLDDPAATRGALREQRRTNDALGTTSSGQWEGYALWLMGSLDEAEIELRDGLAYLQQTGNMGLAASNSAFLAEVLLDQGRQQAAVEAAEFVAATGSATDVSAVVPAWGVIADVLAARGEVVAAVQLANRAVAAAGATDWSELQGEALLHQARVLARAGRIGDSRAAARRAAEAFHRKENVVFAQRALVLQNASIRSPPSP